ncbi:HlyD family secretion protein [Breoghania sp. L-A4]|nr:HlyD family secretion protein [Breoghania sp. L-A4]
MASTDDAYVTADITTVQAKIPGYVASIEVRDNQHVRAGDVLLRLDDGDYKLAVRAARDGVAGAEATVSRIDQQIAAAKASVLQADAAVAAMEAKRDVAKADYSRASRLVAANVTSQATLDSADAERKSAASNLETARAAVAVARANVKVLESQRVEAENAVASAETALAKAERDLSFAIIRSPVDGIVSNRAAQLGTLLQAGSRVAALVPLEAVRIDANFKETQLEGIAPGAHVKIAVDAYPDADIEGVVESISPATGSVFSLLPSENATGNFTKVVQRVPVRITVPKSAAENGYLRAGMSVIVDIDTRTGGPDPVHTAAR